MKRTLSISFFTALVVAAALLAGCGSSGIGDVLGGSRDNDRYGQVGDVRGTVRSVNTSDRTIVVDREGSSYNLRNGGSDQAVLYYDSSTRVEYQSQTYRPEDLERGDRISANVDDSGNRLYARDIQVLYDATSGGSGDYQTQGNQDTLGTDLRGVVRYVDTRGRILEIEPSSRYDSRYPTDRNGVVVVSYDSQTTVDYQGRRYQPDNLERGDEVEINVRDSGGRLLAEQITVVAENQPVTR